MRVNLYATYRDMAGVKRLELEGATVGEVLEALLERHPELAAELLGAPGVLSERVSLFLNGRDVRYLQGLATPLSSTDVIDIFPPVAGGAPHPAAEGAGDRAGTPPLRTGRDRTGGTAVLPVGGDRARGG